jgi:hypothetical protein
MKAIRVKHIMTHSTESKSYAQACHEKVYIMIITIYINIFLVVKIFDYVVCFVADNGEHIACTGRVLHKCLYEKRWRLYQSDS